MQSKTVTSAYVISESCLMTHDAMSHVAKQHADRNCRLMETSQNQFLFPRLKDVRFRKPSKTWKPLFKLSKGNRFTSTEGASFPLDFYISHFIFRSWTFWLHGLLTNSSRATHELFSNSWRILHELFLSSSRALHEPSRGDVHKLDVWRTQHGNKIVNQNVQIRPIHYTGVNLLYINFQNIEIYNCQEFEIIVQLMMCANHIFKPCFKKYIYL